MDPLDELTSREPTFYRPAPGTDVASMLTDDFWEVGASGRVYDREQILAILADRMRNPPEDHWETGDVRCQELAPDVYLLTYALRRGGRPHPAVLDLATHRDRLADAVPPGHGGPGTIAR
jgi:hypothetical protein